MKGKLGVSVVVLCLAGALALAPTVFGATAVTKVKCSATYTSLTPGKLKGATVGLVTCGKPFGNGIQWVKYTETLTAAGDVTARGTFKAWSDTGTVRGTYKLAGKLNLVTGAGTVAGKSKVTGGTGVFSGARGTGVQTCTTTDAGAHLSCKFTLRFTKL